MRLPRLLTPRTVASAHCDLPCGVYDPAQARIEAESVKAICEKYQANTDPEFRTRALIIKEQRAELVKHHLWVLWTDYFKAAALREVPATCTQLFNEATKLAGASGAKGSADPAKADELLAQDRRDREDLLGDQAGVSQSQSRDPAGTSRGRAGRRRDGARTGRVRTGAGPVPPHRERAARRPVRPLRALFGHVAVRADVDDPIGFEDALRFYRRVGAAAMDEWTVQRVTGDALHRLAANPDPSPGPYPALKP